MHQKYKDRTKYGNSWTERKANIHVQTDMLIPIYTTGYKSNKTSVEPSNTLSFEILYIDGFKISELLNYISIIGEKMPKTRYRQRTSVSVPSTTL